PNGGETVSGLVEVKFTIEDINTDEEITYEVFYSVGSESNWIKISQGTGRGEQIVFWDTINLLGADTVLIKVKATDPHGLSGEDTSDFSFSLKKVVQTAGFTIPVLMVLPTLAIVLIFRRHKRKNT
ncbi:MAG: hypothetical protein ACFFBD_15770, partial [Candidatus Hodarchaeota archaeon]